VPWTSFGRAAAAAEPPLAFARLLAVLQIGQSWDLFAPQPVNQRHRFAIQATLADGSSVDLLQRLPHPPLRPAVEGRAIAFANGRWRKLFSRLEQLSPEQWTALGRYFCQAVRPL